MAARRMLNLLAATMLGTMDSNALVSVIALYAQHVGADLLPWAPPPWQRSPVRRPSVQ